MLKESYELIVIGGGPAGLAAALGAKEAGLNGILIVERMPDLGGVLYQCIHMGFGLKRFGEELTGPEYADRMISFALEARIDILTDATVLHIGNDRKVIIASAEEGVVSCSTQAVILATGCRERPIGMLPVAGTRPAGVFTAGAVQQMINLKGYDIGNRVLILGSGDIGLIMARRLLLQGKSVLGVIEQYPFCSGLLRNRVQCLDDFGIPLLTGHTVTEVFGDERIMSVAVCPVDEKLSPIFDKRFHINCDTLVTSVGLIPETELLDGLGIKQVNGDIYVNGQMQTVLPWLFVCGNALFVHDLVDEVSCEAEKTGMNAAAFVKGRVSGTLPGNGLCTAPRSNKLNENELVCTICPQGCILKVNGESITGADCERGVEYARSELTCPMRYITATVAVEGNPYSRLPVRSVSPVPKDRISDIMKEIKNASVPPFAERGQVVIRNAGGTDADFVSTRELKLLK